MNLEIGNVAAAAATDARDRLGAVAARANERTMGAVAHQALFVEALLGAVKARVDELKTVAK
jgi:hypothetical protein